MPTLTNRIVTALKERPTSSMMEIAEDLGCNPATISRINQRYRIRAPRTGSQKQGSLVESSNVFTDAKSDLLESLRLYDCKRDKVAMLRGYMQAAEELLQTYR